MNRRALPPRGLPLRGFTLIELLVVIAVISVLAAILFPVFARAREKARQTACLSNMKQIGTAVQMYVSDYDERLFFYPNATPGETRAGATVSVPNSQKDAERWWNVVMPYVKNVNIWACPSDTAPTPSNDINSQPTILRSYIACRAAEDLTLTQLADPQETIVVTEKWEKNSGGAVTDAWLESFNGDFDPDTGADPSRMFKAGNRHAGFANCAFFDGHAKALNAGDIQASKDLTGCNLINTYPVPTYMTTNSTPPASGEPNICAGFTYP